VQRILITSAFFAALIALWKAGTVVGGWSPVLLPPPEAVAEYLDNMDEAAKARVS